MSHTERAVIAWIERELAETTSAAVKETLADLKQDLLTGAYLRARPRRGRATVRVVETNR